MTLARRLWLAFLGFSTIPLLITAIILADGLIGINDRVTKSASSRIHGHQHRALETFAIDQAFVVRERLNGFLANFNALVADVSLVLADEMANKDANVSVQSLEKKTFAQYEQNLEGFSQPRINDPTSALWSAGQRTNVPPEIPLVSERFAHYQSVFRHKVRHLYFAYPDGQSLIYPRTKSFSRTFDARLLPWFAEALASRGATQVISPYLDLNSGKMMFAIAAFLEGSEGEPQGIVAVELEFDAFLRLPPGRSGWLDDAGLAVIEENESGELSLLSLIRHNKKSVSYERVLDVNNLINSQSVKQAFDPSADKGSAWIENAGIGYQLSWARISENFFLAATIPEEEWESSSDDLTESLTHSLSLMGPKGLFVITAIILLALFCASYFARGMVKPIRRLQKVARKVSAGDFSARTEVEREDELGELANDLDKMASQLLNAKQAEEAATMQMLSTMMRALERRDTYTASHSGRVARYSRMLGGAVGLEKDELQMLYRGALMHDIGKIGVPDGILNKPERLTDNEYQIMQEHPSHGLSILKPMTTFKAFAEIAGYHHERWDGEGYPEGLAGEDIPLLARIVAIADTYDTLTGGRVYRDPVTQEEALSLMEREADSGQWDPELVRCFVTLMKGRAC